MPKIGICVKNLTSGGAEKQAVMLANALAPRHHVAFIILNGEKVHEKYIDMLVPGISIVKFVGERKERLAQYRQYIRTAAPDLIFSYLTAANYYKPRLCDTCGDRHPQFKTASYKAHRRRDIEPVGRRGISQQL